jgi:CRP-like cAMP-binding protein
MQNKLVAYFSRMTDLSPEEAAAIAAAMNPQPFKKGTHLLQAGQRSTDTYFVVEGCIREYIMNDGEEKTTNFFTENQWVISLTNFNPDTPVQHNLVCAEDCVLVVGNEQQAQEMFKQFPRFETISRAVMEAVFGEQKTVLLAWLTDSPEQRYLKLMHTRPDLLQRIPQYQLASYIGVKPESLSRIRKRLAKQS